MISQILQIWLYDMIMMHCKQNKFAIYLVTLFKEKKITPKQKRTWTLVVLRIRSGQTEL